MVRCAYIVPQGQRVLDHHRPSTSSVCHACSYPRADLLKCGSVYIRGNQRRRYVWGFRKRVLERPRARVTIDAVMVEDPEGGESNVNVNRIGADGDIVRERGSVGNGGGMETGATSVDEKEAKLANANGKGNEKGAVERDDSDNEKFFSTGITVVSGCDAHLRRQVIETIASSLEDRKVVVVTTQQCPSPSDVDGMDPIAEELNDALATERKESKAALQETPDNGSLTDEASSDLQQSASKTNGGDQSSSSLKGWISCNGLDEMATVVGNLTRSREYDNILVEGSVGTSVEPQNIAKVLQSQGGANVRVDALVSVLDCESILRDLHLDESSTENDTSSVRGTTDDDTRVMNVVSLVENANVVVLPNQSQDQQTRENWKSIKNVVATLNLNARIVRMDNGQIPVSNVVDTNLYNSEDLVYNPTWRRVLVADRVEREENGSAKPEYRMLPKSLKEATFVYRATRPFHPTRLYEHIKDVATFTGVIRSRGKLWLATRMRAPLEWNQAGDSATLRTGKAFWAEIPEDNWPTDDAMREKIMTRWDNQFGDRETEVVFVGMGIEKANLQGLLDGCLLQDEEMAFKHVWESFEDPFVEWVPLDDDEVEVDEAAQSKSSLDAEGSESSEVEASGEAEQNADSSDEQSVAMEGQIDAESLDSEQLNKVATALDLFDGGESYGGRELDDGQEVASEEEDDIVVASWDAAEARGILEKIPSHGLPVTIVTGFLGSGKTTLLNYILSADHGLKIAVLVNEFGEIDIDSQLVEKGDWTNKDEVMELANGCICCSINESFVTAIEKILERGDDVNYLIVETTGVADPFPVINSLLTPNLDGKVRIDGILTIVDVENFSREGFTKSQAARAQVDAADTILLSKTDVVDEDRVTETVKYIQELRPEARVIKSKRGRVPLDLILDIGVRISSNKGEVAREGSAGGENTESMTPESHDHDHSHDHGSKHDHNHDHAHDHDCGPECTDESHDHSSQGHLEADGFMSASFKSDLALDPHKFKSDFMEQLPAGVFRAKGLLHFSGYPQRYVFQLSGRRFELSEDEWPEGVAPGCQLVVIGRELNIAELRGMLEKCQVASGNL